MDNFFLTILLLKLKGTPLLHFLMEGKAWSLWWDFLIFLERADSPTPLRPPGKTLHSKREIVNLSPINI